METGVSRNIDNLLKENERLIAENEQLRQELERIQTITEAQKRSLFLRQVIDAIPSIIYVKDKQGRYLMGNKAFADFIGKKTNTFGGLRDVDVFPGERGELYNREDKEVLKRNTMIVFPEEKLEHNGKTHWFQTIKTPLVALEGKEPQVLGVSVDITERRKFEDDLHFQLGFKELISSISTRFINISYKEIDQAIRESLALIGQYIVSDRLVVMISEGTQFKNCYSWYSEQGVSGKSVPIDRSAFTWEIEQIRSKGYLYYPNATKIPAEAKVLRKKVKVRGIKSILVLPIQTKNVIFGYLAISSTTGHRYWGNDSVALLKIATQIISGALERKATEELLNFRVEFENIITSISTNFINIPPQLIDKEINEALKYICDFLNIDRGYIYQADKENETVLMSHAWLRGMGEAGSLNALKMNAGQYSWVDEQLIMHGILSVPNFESIPGRAENLRKLMRSQGFCSMICVPIKYGGRYKGALVFASLERENFWPEEAVPLLKISGQVFANALERKQVEENLTETKELYRTLASNIPKSAVLLFDRDLRYRLVEGAALEEQGYSKKNIEGRTIYQVLPISSRRKLLPMYKEALQGKENIFERAFNNKHYLIHILPVKNDQGDIYAGMVMSMDISDLKETQSMLEAKTNVLKRSNEELKLFAYAASHDLQEPLRMISSYVHLIQRSLGNNLAGDVKEFMHYTVDGVMRMQQLINDLLAYSRVDRKEAPFKSIKLDPIIELVKINLKTIIEEAGAEIICHPLPTVTGDQSQIISLFQNLIGNAIKFRSSEKCVIEIGSKEFKNKHRFYIKDNGIGIDDKYFERIFIIFQRLNSRNDYPGTGMGLAICKKIVERHGGKMWLRSIPGKGATFYFEIAKSL